MRRRPTSPPANQAGKAAASSPSRRDSFRVVGGRGSPRILPPAASVARHEIVRRRRDRCRCSSSSARAGPRVGPSPISSAACWGDRQHHGNPLRPASGLPDTGLGSDFSGSPAPPRPGNGGPSVCIRARSGPQTAGRAQSFWALSATLPAVARAGVFGQALRSPPGGSGRCAGRGNTGEARNSAPGDRRPGSPPAPSPRGPRSRAVKGIRL